MPGDMLVAHSDYLADHGAGALSVVIRKGDTLFVVSSVATVPRTTGEVCVIDSDLVGDHYPDRYFIQALWRSLLVETYVDADTPFCSVVRL